MLQHRAGLFDRMMDKLMLCLVVELRLIPQARTPGSGIRCRHHRRSGAADVPDLLAAAMADLPDRDRPARAAHRAGDECGHRGERRAGHELTSLIRAVHRLLRALDPWPARRR